MPKPDRLFKAGNNHGQFNSKNILTILNSQKLWVSSFLATWCRVLASIVIPFTVEEFSVGQPNRKNHNHSITRQSICVFVFLCMYECCSLVNVERSHMPDLSISKALLPNSNKKT